MATNTEHPQKRAKRQPDGEIEFESNGRTIVNANRLAKILNCPPATIHALTNRPGGLPFFRTPSPDPKRKGLRKLFDLDVAKEYYLSGVQTTNPTRSKGKRQAVL
jgi:hypothetical protein